MPFLGKDWGDHYSQSELLEEILIRELHREPWCQDKHDTVMRHQRDRVYTVVNTDTPYKTIRGVAIVRKLLVDELKLDGRNKRLNVGPPTISTICTAILNKPVLIHGNDYESIDEFIIKSIEENSAPKLNSILNEIREQDYKVKYYS